LQSKEIMPRRYTLLLIIPLLVGMLGVFPSGLAAEEESAPEPDPQTKQSIQYYKEGVRAARSRAYEEAIRWFEASLSLKPDVVAPRFSLGYVFEKTGRLREAEQAYRDVIAYQPRNPKAYLNLGNVLESQGRLSEAEGAYLESIRLNPKFARGHNNLAWLWVSSTDPSLRKPQDALTHAEKAVNLTERMEAGPLDTLAEVYYALGECLKAVWTEQEAVSEEPGEPQYKKSLQRFKYCRDAGWASRDGDASKAQRLWLKVIEISPNDWRAREELARFQ
jgi:Flp pilus assembly protein TadD